MDGLVPGRIVYFVFDQRSADEVNRRRTTGASIAERIKANVWPLGAQAHIGSHVSAGEILPAQIVRVSKADGVVNLKVALDGSDTYWAVDVPYGEWTPEAESLPPPRTWHWMYAGQASRGSAR
jgi:hypothetical protein